MELNWDLIINAIVIGIVLGGFHASVAIGVTIAFGMLDSVNIAHGKIAYTPRNVQDLRRNDLVRHLYLGARSHGARRADAHHNQRQPSR